MPWMSVLPAATGRGVISVAGPSLMNPRWANDISHSVVRAPRAASVLSNVALTLPGIANCEPAIERFARTVERVSVCRTCPASVSDTVRGKRMPPPALRQPE
jgi:hypothetical protein